MTKVDGMYNLYGRMTASTCVTVCIGVPHCGEGHQPVEGGAGHTSPTGRNIPSHCGHDEWCVG